MSGTRLTIDPESPQDFPVGRVDHEVLDATGDEDIARQARDDDAELRILDKAPETALPVLG